MKLLVHNFLSSKFLRGVQTGYPLRILPTKVTRSQNECEPEFVQRMVPRLDWGAFRSATLTVADDLKLPEELPPQWQDDETLVQTIHQALVGVDIEEGELECPETGRKFKITEGIPNMLAREDEVSQ